MHPDTFFDLPEPVEVELRKWIARVTTATRDAYVAARLVADTGLDELDEVLRAKRGCRR